MVQRGGFGVIGLTVVLACAPLGAGRAQQPEEGARESVERATRAAEAQETMQEYSGGAIPFEAVLMAPEDIRLNLAYAREQIAAGDLKEGAATLERILLMQPALSDVRVLYGLVLYRLGLLDRARFELEKALESSALAPTVRAEAEAYLERIKRLQRATTGSITLTLGAEWDENRNQSPSSGQVLFIGIPLPASPAESDFAYLAAVQGRLSHDLGFQAGHAAHGEISYYRSDKNEVDTLDLDALSFATGVTLNFGNLSVTPRVRASEIWLAGEEYLTSGGGDIEVLYRVRPDLRTYLNFRGEHEDFRVVSGFEAAPLRTGRRMSARAGATWRVSPRRALTFEGLWMDKNGQTPFESFGRYGAFAQHSWLHGRGAFTLIGAWAEHSDHDGPDPFISPATRSEWLYRGRVTAGAPLSWFTRSVDLPKAVSSINLIAQYEYEKVDSNIANFDYDTHKASLLLSKRIGF